MITKYYTSEELRLKIASREYNAELLLQHAMFRLDESERELATERQRAESALHAEAELIRLAEDMLSTFRVDAKTVLVTEERVEAWRSVLSRVRVNEAEKGGLS